MFKFLGKIKYNLSHISSKSWHFQTVEFVFGERRARGSSCSYYWWKLPLSLFAMLVVYLVEFFSYVLHILTLGLAWIMGFRYKGYLNREDSSITNNIFAFENAIGGKTIFYKYKERKDGTHAYFAPWQILLVLVIAVLAFYLVFVNPGLGLKVLICSGYILLILLAGLFLGGFIYLISKGWKNPRVQKARQGVSNAWKKVCPPLFVDGDAGLPL